MDPYIGYGMLTLINAGIAQGKNRSGFAWFALTGLVGLATTLSTGNPFGCGFVTLLLVLSSKLPHEKQA